MPQFLDKLQRIGGYVVFSLVLLVSSQFPSGFQQFIFCVLFSLFLLAMAQSPKLFQRLGRYVLDLFRTTDPQDLTGSVIDNLVANVAVIALNMPTFSRQTFRLKDLPEKIRKLIYPHNNTLVLPHSVKILPTLIMALVRS